MADPTYKSFLASVTTWQKSGKAPNRGMVDDADGTENKQTAVEKCTILNMMLEGIANWCQYISRTFIIKQTTCLDDVWRNIREHYGFLCTGGHFLDICAIHRESEERPEDLYQRIFMFFEDNLVSANSLSHHGERLTSDEEMTPTVENAITWYWLKLLHPGLPQLVQQRYGAELRDKTLASIKSEISSAMSALLDELSSIEESRVMRTGHGSSNFRDVRTNSRDVRTNSRDVRGNQSRKSCTLCKAARRPHNTHWLTECSFLPESDRRAFSRSTTCEDDENPGSDGDEPVDANHTGGDPYIDVIPRIVRRVRNMASPVLDVLHSSGLLKVTIDSGSTSNMIRESICRKYGITVYPNTQTAGQADGVSKLDTVGEVHFSVELDGTPLFFDGLVVKNLGDDILGGIPFMSENDIGVRPSKSQIIIGGSDVIHYDSKGVCDPMVRRTHVSLTLRAPPCQTVLLPGESLCLKTPPEAIPNSTWAVEPRCDNDLSDWFTPQEITDTTREIRVRNETDEPISIKKNIHVCQIRSVTEITEPSPTYTVSTVPSLNTSLARKHALHSNVVSINPDNLVSSASAKKAADINRMYDQVFCPDLPLYNGHSGRVECHINMGPVKPPQRKGRLPYYDHKKMVLLQEHFDDLERQGVLRKPEEVGVVAEYLNMSFLVVKPGKNSFRFVTAFGEIGEYSKPQPSVMPNVEDTLRTIGRWKYVIKTDLKQAYFQIPLSKESQRYAGTASPFKGVRVYDRAAMGLPGSETALEELMNRVAGDLIMEGVAAKVADDCYCGGETVEGALHAYERLLASFAANNLGLNPSKTIIFPKRVVILGWVWEMGTLSASSHRIDALSAVEPPTTVKALRSFIGAYKYIGRVIRWHSDYMSPLDQLVAGRDSKDRIKWTEEDLIHFNKAKESLQSCVRINIAKPSDQIWIQTDGALRPDASAISGLAATLFLVRNGKVLLGGFFNAQFKKGQRLWLPCEVEALAIGSAITYFSPLIVQSEHRVKVATDSKACVQAYQRMRRGLFSHSARVMTFLTAVCRYQVEVVHISGVDIPFTDYVSRHPVQCVDNNCAICKFVDELADSVVRKLTVQDVIEGHSRMPFISRQSWLDSQKECRDLRKVHALLTLGNRPAKKDTKCRDVKTYLHKVVIAHDGLLVVRDVSPLRIDRERIVVPRNFVKGLLMAYHLKFDHPTAHQLNQLIKRYFYAINIDKHITDVSESCDTCNSLKFVPDGLCDQSSLGPSPSVGTSFAFDVINRERQKIAVLRESLTSYTTTMIINSENHQDLRNAIIILSVGLKGTHSHIRVDPAPGLACLRNDAILKGKGISITPGDEKNKNKNPVAERAVQELEQEILRVQPEKGPVSTVTLAVATANTNSRVRRDGLSARELWTQRDQLTGSQLPFDDEVVKISQAASRARNHPSSAKSKARGRDRNSPHVSLGDLVYLVSDRSKNQAREKYLVTALSGNTCTVRKFSRLHFRRKKYSVPLTGVYLITGGHHHSGHDPVDISSSSDSDDDFIVQSVLPNVRIESSEEEEEDVASDTVDNNVVDNVNNVDVVNDVGRSVRQRRQPDRHGDIVVGDDYDRNMQGLC